MPDFRMLPTRAQELRISRRQILAGAAALGIGGASYLALRDLGSPPGPAALDVGAQITSSPRNGPLRCLASNIADQAGEKGPVTGVSWVCIEAGAVSPP